MKPKRINRHVRAGLIFLVVVALSMLPVQAAERTDWFHEAGWGVMTHYLGAPPSSSGGKELTAQMWNRQVDAFDVEGLANQLASAGTKYLLFTIGLEIDLEEFNRVKQRSMRFGMLVFFLGVGTGVGIGLLFVVALSQEQAAAVVAAQAAVGRGEQVAKTSQAVEGAGQATEALEHHPDLRQPTAEQGGLGIGTKGQAIGDARSHGHHVLEGTGSLAADRIRIGVEPQATIAELELHRTGQLGVAAGQHRCSRQSLPHFRSQIRTAQNQ